MFSLCCASIFYGLKTLKISYNWLKSAKYQRIITRRLTYHKHYNMNSADTGQQHILDDSRRPIADNRNSCHPIPARMRRCHTKLFEKKSAVDDLWLRTITAAIAALYRFLKRLTYTVLANRWRWSFSSRSFLSCHRSRNGKCHQNVFHQCCPNNK